MNTDSRQMHRYTPRSNFQGEHDIGVLTVQKYSWGSNNIPQWQSFVNLILRCSTNLGIKDLVSALLLLRSWGTSQK